jgi:hypothetical protein
MTALSTYFHPDEVMLKLAGLISEGLKYHAAAMHLISADDQVDDIAYGEAIEQAEREAMDPKMAVAMAFRDNKVSALEVRAVASGNASATQPKREYYQQQMTLNVSFKKTRRKFRKEIARITHVPVLKPSANGNTGTPDKVKAAGNIASMEDWRDKLRKSA